MGKPGATAKKALNLIGTGLCTGYLPLAPATWASFFSLVIWYLIRYQPLVVLSFGIATFISGIITASALSEEYGPDPRIVVIDEIAAMFLLLSFLRPELKSGLIAFCLFRFFDVIKPPPIRIVERLPGGLGIMADDLIAAVYARVVTIIILMLL